MNTKNQKYSLDVSFCCCVTWKLSPAPVTSSSARQDHCPTPITCRHLRLVAFTRISIIIRFYIVVQLTLAAIANYCCYQLTPIAKLLCYQAMITDAVCVVDAQRDKTQVIRAATLGADGCVDRQANTWPHTKQRTHPLVRFVCFIVFTLLSLDIYTSYIVW